MQENGGRYSIPNPEISSDANQIQINSSFHGEEPPPDPEDFGTKEEEKKNRELLSRLYENQKKLREITERRKLEEKIRKELEEEQRLKELYAKKAYYQRRNQSAKYRVEANNRRIKEMLTKVEDYMNKISRLDSIGKIKEQAQKELEEEIIKEKKIKKRLTKKEIEKMAKLSDNKEKIRKDNIKQIEQRKNNEILKKQKKEKAEKANKRAEKILKNGYKLPKAGDTNYNDKKINLRSGGLGIFKEEEKIEGTNSAPVDINANNKIKRPNSSIKINNKEENISPKEKLKIILKKDPYNLYELLKFQKKYKYIDISSHIHKAKMTQIKSNKNKHRHNKIKNGQEDIEENDDDSNDISEENENDNNNEGNNKIKFEFEEGVINEGDNLIPNENGRENENEEEININEEEPNKKKKKKKKKKSKSQDKKSRLKKIKQEIKNNYLIACKYNNDEYIRSILRNTDTDEKIYEIINERDKYNRNGLMYLLIHNNTNMIKLSLLSGVKLDETKDIFGRNLIHYCCTNNVTKSILDIICHCIDFKNFGELCAYVNKCIPITKRENVDLFSDEFLEQCENKIKEFDDLMEIKFEEDELDNIKKEENNNANIKKMVNTADNDGNYPIHYLAKNNNLDKIEILKYYHADLNVEDKHKNKAINLTTNEVIQQYLLKNEENDKSKKNANNNSNNPLPNNNSNINDILNIDKIRYYSPEKINSYFMGVENNSLLMLSVINNNYSLFKFLITEKKASVDYINGNGWSVLFFIVSKNLWNFFSFLFDLPNHDQCLTPELVYNSLEQRTYNKNELIENNGSLTFLGQAIKIIDNLSNKNDNILSLCVDMYNDINILKIFLDLYDTYIKYFAMKEEKNIEFQRQYGKYDESSFLNIIFNRHYGKNKETILIKYTKKKDINAIKFLLNELYRKKQLLNLDIYKGDINNQNILHHAVLTKNKKLIKFLSEFDSDNNLLKTNKDIKGKTAFDLDRTKSFEYELITVWDAAKKNDVNLLNKLINELKYYEVNSTTYIFKNTPLHYAVKYKADKAILFLLKNGADKDKKNGNGFTPIDTVEKVKFPDKKWVKLAKKILNGELKELTDLNASKINKELNESHINNNKSSISNINNGNNKDNENKNSFGKNFITNMRLINLMRQIKEAIDTNKIDIKNIFVKYDKNNTGKLSVKEFTNLLNELNVPELTEDDIDYLLICLDTKKDGKLLYKEFVSLLE